MPDTKDLAAIAWNGLCVYGDEKSINAVRAAVVADISQIIDLPGIAKAVVAKDEATILAALHEAFEAGQASAISGENILDGLNFAIQYRRKSDGIEWRAMAAFDVQGPAETYYEAQGKTEGCPWEYRLIEIHDAVTAADRDEG